MNKEIKQVLMTMLYQIENINKEIELIKLNGNYEVEKYN